MLYLVLCRTRAWWIPSWCLWSSWDPSTTFSRFVCLSASVSIMMHRVICCTNSVQGSVPASKGQQMMHIVNFFSFLFLAESMFPTHHEKAWCIWSLGWLFWRCTFGLWLKISLLAFSVVVIFKYSSFWHYDLKKNHGVGDVSSLRNSLKHWSVTPGLEHELWFVTMTNIVSGLWFRETQGDLQDFTLCGPHLWC